jgi:hypothetical protein
MRSIKDSAIIGVFSAVVFIALVSITNLFWFFMPLDMTLFFALGIFVGSFAEHCFIKKN